MIISRPDLTEFQDFREIWNKTPYIIEESGWQKETGTGFLLPAAFLSILDFVIILVIVVEIPILWYAIKELCPEFTWF